MNRPEYQQIDGRSYSLYAPYQNQATNMYSNLQMSQMNNARGVRNIVIPGWGTSGYNNVSAEKAGAACSGFKSLGDAYPCQNSVPGGKSCM